MLEYLLKSAIYLVKTTVDKKAKMTLAGSDDEAILAALNKTSFTNELESPHFLGPNTVLNKHTSSSEPTLFKFKNVVLSKVADPIYFL